MRTGQSMLKVLSITSALILVAGVFGCSQPDQPPITTASMDDNAEHRLHPLISNFTNPEWERVNRAAEAFERQPKEAIPLLIHLLDRDEHVKLQNTADLIYPGAERFYGHGWIVNYDLDWLSVRAGWTLEEITFRDFGFSEQAINEGELLSAVAAGKRDVPLGDVTKVGSDATQRKDRRTKAITRAREWWRSNGANWTRLTALVDALRSDSRHCVLNALSWLRHGESPIEGFTRELYVKDIYAVVQRLAKSQDEEISAQAQYLVDDFDNDEWYWLQPKTGQGDPES